MSDFLSAFVAVTGAPESIASQYLDRNDNDVEQAINDFYSNEKDPASYKEQRESVTKPQQRPTKPKSMFQSFSDLRNAGAVAGDDEDDKDDMNFFTGGEKSGLEVENPDKKNKKKTSRSLVEDLLKKAQEEAGKADWRDEDKPKSAQGTSSFKGQGHSLGSVEQAVESTAVGSSLNDTNADPTSERVTRTITFWKEGFSVDDGKLYKYEDKENEEYLKQLNSGRAPLSLLNVKMFQDVDVNVHKRLEDSYYANQQKKARTFGFEGQGQRLGSPVPGDPINQFTPEPVVTPTAVNPEKEEKGEGDSQIQIRLANGERIIRKFNSTDSVELIYEFVSQIVGGNESRPWSLALSFPMTILDDKKQSTILECGLKNSVIIQRWK